ncbi:MAG: Dabb family protein [Brachybacterium sp.]|nr:Dabb family protein [Brachybacterium sp.]
MIRHTVSFTLVHDPDSAAEQDFLTQAPALLREIDGVEDFTVSRQVSPKSDYRFQFAMTFADQATFDAYDAHPTHQEFVATRWQSEVSAFEELDFIAYP